MNPNELYQYYLNAYSIPQSTDMGVLSVAPIADFQVRDSGIATLQPTTTGTGTMPTLFGMTPSQYAKSYVNNPANVLGTLASFTLGPIPGFLTTQAGYAAQRRGIIPQNFTDMFGNVFNRPVGTTFGDGIDEGISNVPGMNFGSRLDDPSLDAGDSGGNGVGSGADEGGSGADSGSGSHSDPGD